LFFFFFFCFFSPSIWQYTILPAIREPTPTSVINTMTSTSIPQTTSPSQTMSNPTHNPVSTPNNNSIEKKNSTGSKSAANPSLTEDTLMQDPDTSSHENETLDDTIVATMSKARAKEARLHTKIGNLEARIAPLESSPLPENMKKLALTKCRRKLLKAQRKLRRLVKKEFKATTPMNELLAEKLVVARVDVAMAKVALQGMRTWLSGRKPIARGAARRSWHGPAPRGGWGNMMPVTSHAAYAARQRAEGTGPPEVADQDG
jgi:hypothetical protein